MKLAFREPRPPSERPAKPALHVEDDDQSSWKSGGPGTGHTLLWIGLIIATFSILGIVFSWDRVSAALGFDEHGGAYAEFMRTGATAYAKGTEAEYRQAIQSFEQAKAIDPESAQPFIAIAETNAAWAQALRFRREDLEADPAPSPATRVDIEALKKEEGERIELAMEYARTSTKLDPTNVEALVVLADALRLSGQLAKARQELDRARRLQAERPKDYHRVSALLTADENQGDLAAARSDGERAVDTDGSCIQCRLLLARILIARSSVSRAREQIREVLSRAPTHPDAVALDRAL
ncbi:MAG: tetratricopeptide repeat protein, partial [Myxococcales bacterium]|nr:tetratricopeptide repeat protein [Myxococcales bacterium]